MWMSFQLVLFEIWKTKFSKFWPCMGALVVSRRKLHCSGTHSSGNSPVLEHIIDVYVWSSAYWNPLLDMGHFVWSSACRIHSLTPSGQRAFPTTFAESWSTLQNSFSPSVIHSSADMASALLLRTYSTSNAGDLGSLSDNLVTNTSFRETPSICVP